MIFIILVQKHKILTHYPKIEPCTFRIPWNNLLHLVTIINPKYNGGPFMLILNCQNFEI